MTNWHYVIILHRVDDKWCKTACEYLNNIEKWIRYLRRFKQLSQLIDDAHNHVSTHVCLRKHCASNTRLSCKNNKLITALRQINFENRSRFKMNKIIWYIFDEEKIVKSPSKRQSEHNVLPLVFVAFCKHTFCMLGIWKFCQRQLSEFN